MGTPWDRAAGGYLNEWVPRFVPYHNDLVRQVALASGARVLVVTAGPGAEVIAVLRTIGPTGAVHATDTSPEMIALCKEQVAKAGFTGVTFAVSDAGDAAGAPSGAGRPPWDAILCAFGLWQIEPSVRTRVLSAWRDTLAPRGKVGVLTWGPPEEDDPFERLAEALRIVEPGSELPSARIHAEREAMATMFDEAGLSLVRHTVVRHTLTFPSAEQFVRAMREGCTWRRRWEQMGDARMEKVARAFYEWTGGPDVPLTFAPPATLAIAGLPGAELELEGRPSVKVPASTRNLS
jgi:ubiquinone/menaquinone biosynthesis C-methylase UbiE